MINSLKSILLLSGLLIGASSAAGAHCDNGSLRGQYAFNVQGMNLGVFDTAGILHPFASPAPFAGVGQYVFDGQGGFTRIDYNENNGAAAFPPSPVNDEGFRTGVSGTYSVDQDCTGTINVNLGSTEVVLAVTIVDYGKEAYAVIKSEHVGSYSAAALPTGTTCDSGCYLGVNLLAQLKQDIYGRR